MRASQCIFALFLLFFLCYSPVAAAPVEVQVRGQTSFQATPGATFEVPIDVMNRGKKDGKPLTAAAVAFRFESLEGLGGDGLVVKGASLGDHPLFSSAEIEMTDAGDSTLINVVGKRAAMLRKKVRLGLVKLEIEVMPEARGAYSLILTPFDEIDFSGSAYTTINNRERPKMRSFRNSRKSTPLTDAMLLSVEVPVPEPSSVLAAAVLFGIVATGRRRR